MADSYSETPDTSETSSRALPGAGSDDEESSSQSHTSFHGRKPVRKSRQSWFGRPGKSGGSISAGRKRAESVGHGVRRSVVISRDSKKYSAALLPNSDTGMGITSPLPAIIVHVLHNEAVFIPRRLHSAAIWNRHIFIFGGVNLRNTLEETFCQFDITTKRFRLILRDEVSPKPRKNCTMDHLSIDGVDQLILIYGIDGYGRLTSDMWRFDILQEHWYKLKDVKKERRPLPRYGHCTATNGTKDKLYVFGGRDKYHINLNDLFVFHNMTWSRVSSGRSVSSPRPRAYSSLVYANEDTDSLILFGGDIGNHGNATNETWMYDLNAHRWRKIVDAVGKPPSPRYSHAAAFLNHQMYILGGITSGWFSVKLLNTLHVYNTIGNCWFEVKLHQGLGCCAEFGNVIIDHNRADLYVFGGVNREGRCCSNIDKICTTLSGENEKQDRIDSSMSFLESEKAHGHPNFAIDNYGTSGPYQSAFDKGRKSILKGDRNELLEQHFKLKVDELTGVIAKQQAELISMNDRLTIAEEAIVEAINRFQLKYKENLGTAPYLEMAFPSSN